MLTFTVIITFWFPVPRISILLYFSYFIYIIFLRRKKSYRDYDLLLFIVKYLYKKAYELMHFKNHIAYLGMIRYQCHWHYRSLDTEFNVDIELAWPNQEKEWASAKVNNCVYLWSNGLTQLKNNLWYFFTLSLKMDTLKIL